MHPIYLKLVKTLGDKAFYCAGLLCALDKPVATRELVTLTQYDQATVTQLLMKLKRHGLAVRAGRGWRIAPERQLKRG